MVNGIPIKEGCIVVSPLYYLHYRSDCWTDPEQFNPERFGVVHTHIVHSHSTGTHISLTNYFLLYAMTHNAARLGIYTHTTRYIHMPECTPPPPPPIHKCFAPYSFPSPFYRFSKSQKSSINTGAFVPFGSGPRYCIGMRLAAMEAKMTLIEVLSKFRIVKAPETKVIELYVAYTQLALQTFIHMLS